MSDNASSDEDDPTAIDSFVVTSEGDGTFEYIQDFKPGQGVLLKKRSNETPNESGPIPTKTSKKPELLNPHFTIEKDKISGAQLKPFPVGLKPSERRNEWLEWKESLQHMLLLKPTLKTQEEKMAFLVVSGGKEIQKALKGKPIPEETLTKPTPVFDNAMLRLDKHFNSGTSAITDIIHFRNLVQLNGEPFTAYLHRLKTQASYCNFGDAEENEVILQLIKGAIHGETLGRAATRYQRSLADITNIGVCIEIEEQEKSVQKEVIKIKQEETNVAFVRQQPRSNNFANAHRPGNGNRFSPYQNGGRFQGRQLPRNHGRNFNQNRGRNSYENRMKCFSCGRLGHIARACNSNTTNAVHAYSHENNYAQQQQDDQNVWID